MMGNNDAEATSKPEKASSPRQEQVAVHSYPDWAAMQAYYGPGVAIPPPYFTSAVVSGHAPHPYMWSPQPMIPPFGAPYHAIYPHGGYSIPSMPLGSHAHGQGNPVSSVTSEPPMPTPPSTETPSKSPASSKERGLMKKLKGFDGLAVSISNGNSETAGGSVNGQSQSGEGDTERSSDGSEDQSQEGSPTQRKRSVSADTPAKDKNGKGDVKSSTEEANAPVISLSVAVSPSSMTGKAVVAPPLSISPVSSAGKSKPVAASVSLSSSALVPNRESVPAENWMQDERELKRERRKQSNRESARRSRLRKQAETEELALKVESLTSENNSLQLELGRLSEMSEKLRQENSSLMEKLKDRERGESGSTSGETESKKSPSPALENFLTRIDNSSTSNKNASQETDAQSSGAKLHQLLKSSPRADAVTAS